VLKDDFIVLLLYIFLAFTLNVSSDLNSFDYLRCLITAFTRRLWLYDSLFFALTNREWKFALLCLEVREAGDAKIVIFSGHVGVRDYS
jgi:hypothetical protein